MACYLHTVVIPNQSCAVECDNGMVPAIAAEIGVYVRVALLVTARAVVGSVWTQVAPLAGEAGVKVELAEVKARLAAVLREMSPRGLGECLAIAASVAEETVHDIGISDTASGPERNRARLIQQG